jgi:hypothetical protein
VSPGRLFGAALVLSAAALAVRWWTGRFGTAAAVAYGFAGGAWITYIVVALASV